MTDTEMQSPSPAAAPAKKLKRKIGKRLALFLDGTWNAMKDNTNVWRLHALCADRDLDGTRQLRYYNEGVGTRAGEYWRGGMFGYGLDGSVIAAYRWLIENFEKGDDVFVFGFSRGAFTARSLTGLIARCGLLHPGAPLSVDQVFTRYREGGRHPALHELYGREDTEDQPLSRDDVWLRRYSRRVSIRFVGVFDTVGSLGVPFGHLLPNAQERILFHNTLMSGLYRNVCHALAIDEHRGPFNPTLWLRWRPPGPPPQRWMRGATVEQRWFVGAHSNVGGGYENDCLAQLPLNWFVQKANEQGLHFRQAVVLDDRSHLDPITDSYSDFLYGIYPLLKLGKRFHRTIGLVPKPLSTGNIEESVNETIDRSVFARWREDPSYRPPGLVDWALRRSIDPASITESISA